MSDVERGSASGTAVAPGQGVRGRLPRTVGECFLSGRGPNVPATPLPGLKDVAFVRSPLAHARIKAIHVPERFSDVVFTAPDLTGVKPIRAVSGLPGFKISE